jgi:hypothetical protein
MKTLKSVLRVRHLEPQQHWRVIAWLFALARVAIDGGFGGALSNRF